MIKFNEQFSFEKDPNCWQLHEWRDGKSKDGVAKRQKKTTYHASLQQICGAIIERSCGDCESLEEIKHLLENALRVLTKHAEDIAA